MQLGKNVHHISINVFDMKESVRFYKDILGFELVESNIRMPKLELDITYFKLPGGHTMLELIEYDKNKKIDTDVTDGGILRHIAFEIDDIEDTMKQLEKKGVKLSWGPEILDRLGIITILIIDPNNVELEFCQPIKK